MYLVSNNYKESIYAPMRTVKARVIFDISDTTAVGDINTITTTTQSTISDKQQLINKKREQTYNLVTWERDRFKLDGSFCFPDSTLINNKEVGFCSDNISSEDKTFTTFPTITFNFNNPHSSMGITITFDAANNEYAEDFTVTAYDANNNIIDTVDIVGNVLVQAIPIGQLYLYNRLDVIIKKWCKPFRRCRIAEVDFGVVKIYEDSSLIKLSLIEQMDITTNTIPSSEFKFTIDNVGREFNILNPVGVYKFLQERQQVIAELGIETSGTVEYIPLGNYLLSDWNSDEGSLTASFTAKTNLDLMSNFSYENLVAKSSYNLYQMAIDIFTLCGINNYSIDIALQNINTLGIVKIGDCKYILQMIAIASCSNIYVSRNNTIIIKQSTSDISVEVDTIDMNNMYKEPQIKLDSLIKNVTVYYFTDIDTSNLISIDNINITIGGNLKLDNNTLINTSIQANNIANWLLNQKKYRAIYTANWRGNPAQELNDIISIENSYGQNKNTIMTKNEIIYEGYLSAKTELRGEIS